MDVIQISVGRNTICVVNKKFKLICWGHRKNLNTATSVYKDYELRDLIMKYGHNNKIRRIQVGLQSICVIN